ncbi:MAG: ABC transporter substrate binding protein [Gammaproteobacteria bacterium]
MTISRTWQNAKISGGQPWAWLLLLLLVCQAHAHAAGILIVASSGTELYSRFIERLTSSLPGSNPGAGIPDITVVYLDKHTLTDGDLAARNIIIPVGTRAARDVAARQPDIPVLHTIIPESVFLTLAAPPAACTMQSAIFIDQPLARQAALAQALFPDAVDYGVLLGPTSSQRQTEIDALKKDIDRRLVVRIAARESDIAAVTNGLLQQVDLLIAVNDPLVLNRENAKWLLYSAYQRRLPVIGFSRAYVRAGAAGAVFSEPEQMARQAAEVVQRQIASPTACLPAAGFPRYFSVAINQSVCSSLGGALCNEESLGELLATREHGR